jgi:hypothetical protein
MKNIELERAWPAPKAPPGFTDRVMENLQGSSTVSEPAAHGSGFLRWLRARALGRSWLAVPVVALALGALFLLWSVAGAPDGDVIAAESREISIGERVVAEASPGAHIRWRSGDEVLQDSGAVTYRVVPGTRFRVQTPYGSVAVLGTIFRVLVADRDEARGEPMAKKWAIAGAGATLGALLFVSVDRGSVGLSKGEHELVLGPGQAGFVGADGVPRAVPAAARQTIEPPGSARPAYEPRPITEAMRERRRRVLESSAEAKGPVSGSAASARAAAEPQGMKDRTGKFGPEVKALNRQLLPLVDQCFDQAKERGVRGRGMLALGVKLTAADGIGGIIESVEPAPNNAIHDPELIDCVRQSAFTVDLPAPTSSGSRELEMTIPFEGAVDAGAPTSL